MKKFFKINYNTYLVGSLVLVFISLIISILIFLAGQLLPEKIPLFYSLPWGKAQLANHNQLFIIPAAASLITLINLILLVQLHQSQQFFKRMLFLISIINTTILFIAIIKVVLIFF